MSTAQKQRRNRLHLADMLENRITDDNFNMGDWTNHCGTVGCALGIAIMSGEFGYGWNKNRHGVPIAVKNGKEVYWCDAGDELFGYKTYQDVLLRTERRSRQAVAAELRAIK